MLKSQSGLLIGDQVSKWYPNTKRFNWTLVSERLITFIRPSNNKSRTYKPDFPPSKTECHKACFWKFPLYRQNELTT